jgi:hypothetical protein
MDQDLVSQLTPQLVAGASLALLLDLVPGLNTRWASLETRQKQGYNLLLILLVSVLFVVGPGLVQGIWPDGWNWLLVPVSSFFVTLAGNQATYIGTRYVTGSSEPRN